MTQHKDLIWLTQGWPLIALGLFIAYLAPFYVLHIQSIASQWVFNDDERQWVWPMLHYVDLELFHNDYLFNYAMAETPIGYKAIYWLGSLLIDPNWLSKILSYALLIITVTFASLSAARLAGPVAGLAAVALLLVGNFWLDAVAGGLPRSFNPAFSAVTMYLLIVNRPWLIAIMTPIAASIYPPVSIVMGIALTLLFLFPTKIGGPSKSWSIERRILLLVSSGIVTLALLSFTVAERAQFGELIDATNPSDVAAYPERLGRHGVLMGTRSRSADWASVLAMPLDDTSRAVSGEWHLISAYSGIGKLLIIVVFAVCVAINWQNAKELKFARLLVLPIAAIVASLLATVLYPKLFYPSRYLMAVPLFFLLTLPAAFSLSAGKFHISKSRTAVGTLMFLLVFGWKGPEPATGFWIHRDDASVQLLYNYIKTLPKDVLIAGWETVDDVPLLSRRSVLISEEMYNVTRVKYALEMRKRTIALIEGYFAIEPMPLLRLHDDFGVTHIIADRRHFRMGNGPRYFVPFNKWIEDTKVRTADQTKQVERLIESSYARKLTRNVSIIDLAQWAKDAQEVKAGKR